MNNSSTTNIKKITLESPAYITALSGRPQGLAIYDSDMKKFIENENYDILNENILFEIYFPASVKLVSGSYLLGMFENIYKLININGIKNRFKFFLQKDTEEQKENTYLMNLLLNELMRSDC